MDNFERDCPYKDSVKTWPKDTLQCSNDISVYVHVLDVHVHYFQDHDVHGVHDVHVK
jgi:hypothetical protein